MFIIGPGHLQAGDDRRTDQKEQVCLDEEAISIGVQKPDCGAPVAHVARRFEAVACAPPVLVDRVGSRRLPKSFGAIPPVETKAKARGPGSSGIGRHGRANLHRRQPPAHPVRVRPFMAVSDKLVTGLPRHGGGVIRRPECNHFVDPGFRGRDVAPAPAASAVLILPLARRALHSIL